jgi:hypothetical protein
MNNVPYILASGLDIEKRTLTWKLYNWAEITYFIIFTCAIRLVIIITI